MTERVAGDFLRRESGILLHPTSLPGPHGIGDLGREAQRFVDFLEMSGQRLWQILPLGPTGYGNSPYAARSAMAGNPLLISLDVLAKEGLLAVDDLVRGQGLPSDYIDYESVAAFKLPLLQEAYRHFKGDAGQKERVEFDFFCRSHSFWLDDYALFMALRDAHDGVEWLRWDRKVAMRRPEVLDRWRDHLADQIRFHQFVQFQFFRQWGVLKRYANERGIRIIGDIPIFVALDSADVWSRPELFHLDEQGHPTIVAGVPPDYFSSTGQRWGNPLYRWDRMARDGYRWWVERFRIAFTQVDLVRIDHFRGFQAYWEVPAQYETAEHGRWVDGPGEAFFLALEKALGRLPVIAEDLGVITPEVESLRLKLGFPGMKVLQFAFGDNACNPYLPHNYERRYVVYTGTHDNDTTMGWFASRTPKERRNVLRYLGTSGREIHWDLIRLAFASVADFAVIPLQDVLGLGSWARMNMPGIPKGNWIWRLAPGQLKDEHAERLRDLATTYGRNQGTPEPCATAAPAQSSDQTLTGSTTRSFE